MKVYFAGSAPNDAIVAHNANRLVTYVDQKQVFTYWKDSNNKPCFLDSGAFSVFTGKAVVNIDEYISFIKEHKEKIAVYASLDVIQNYEESRKNLLYMESKGLHPLPTFHLGSPFEELVYLIGKYHYIALGGVVAFTKRRELLYDWLDTCFTYIKTKIKVHGFGINSLSTWKRYPFYSVDATSWLIGSRYANLRINRKNHSKKTKSIIGMKLHTETYHTINELSLLDYMREAEFVTKVWEARGVNWS